MVERSSSSLAGEARSFWYDLFDLCKPLYLWPSIHQAGFLDCFGFVSVIANWSWSVPSVGMGNRHSAPLSEDELRAQYVARAKIEATEERRKADVAARTRASEAARAEKVRAANVARARREFQERYGLHPTSALPDYLFRVYHDTSKGINTAQEICSQGSDLFRSPASFNSTQPEKIREHIATHFKSPNSDRQYFIQFTASLLAALFHAERLDRNGYTNVRIAVLRIFDFDARLNIFPADFLVRSYDIRLDNIRSLDLKEEFLIWDFSCFRTYHSSLKALRQHGLYKLLPELKQRMGKCPLAIELQDFRKTLFDDSWAMDITPKELQHAQTLVDVMIGVPSSRLTFQLLCTRRRNSRDPAWADMARNEMLKTASACYFDGNGRRRLDCDIKPYVSIMVESKYTSSQPEMQLYLAMRRQLRKIDHQVDASTAPRGQMAAPSNRRSKPR